MSYTPKNNFNLKIIETGVDPSVYIPENNSNLQLKRTGVGEKAFKKKLLADVACCNALDYDFRFDFNPDYLSSGNGIVIFILEGCPNFTWEITGSNFTLAEIVTSDRYNIIMADDLTEGGITETLTVTDFCGTIITADITSCSGLNCCDKPTYEFTYSGDDPIVMVKDINSCEYYNYWLRLKGGCSPILWESDHADIKFMNKYSNVPRNQFTVVGEDAYEGTLTVTDECGTVIEVGYTVCCNNPDYTFSVTGDLGEVESEGTSIFTITGGCSPYQWFSDIPELTWAEEFTTGLTNDLTLTGDLSGYTSEDLYVKDSCCEIALICSFSVRLVWDPVNNPETIGSSIQIPIYIIGGKGPYQWSVSGTGFTLWDGENLVTELETEEDVRTTIFNADDAPCGTAIITITDFCGITTIGYIRCIYGQWNYISATCSLPGVIGSITDTSPNHFTVTAIEGGKKQIENHSMTECVWQGGWEKDVGTCEELLEQYCTGGSFACLSYTTPCSEIRNDAIFNCGSQQCRSECYHTWSPSQGDYKNLVYICSFGNIGYQYFEWGCPP